MQRPHAPLIAIDPGPLTSAYVVLTGPRQLVDKGILANDEMRTVLGVLDYSTCVIEYTPPYTLTMGSGRAYVPRQVVDTAIEIGRMVQVADERGPCELLSRLEVKKHLLGRATGNDSDVRAALLDCWGCRTPQQARGTVKEPGPLHGVTKDLWAALAVGVTFWEQRIAPARRRA